MREERTWPRAHARATRRFPRAQLTVILYASTGDLGEAALFVRQRMCDNFAAETACRAVPTLRKDGYFSRTR